MPHLYFTMATCNYKITFCIAMPLQLDKAIVFLIFVLPIFSQNVRVGGRNKNKNKIHSDHFPIELRSKETFDFNSIGKWSK